VPATDRPINRVIVLMTLVAGLGALTGAGLWAWRTLSFKASASQTEGVVVKLVTSRGSARAGQSAASRGGGPSYAPVFEFKDAGGRSHRVTNSTSSRPASYDVGEKVGVLYSPQNPDEARIDSFFSLWGGPAIFGSVGLIFTSSAVVILVKRRRRS
jgi:hypothetical protein